MLDIALVIPVYNEEECICAVIEDWKTALQSKGLSYIIFILNDGSTDNTRRVLGAYDSDAQVTVIHKANSGHGPTILQGYNKAVQEAEWVFQVDSDNEIAADYFERLWNNRSDYDAVIGVRDNRVQPLSRKIVSSMSGFVVRILFGSGVKDVNCPYRLFRADVLSQLLAEIPPETFAPNIAISGLLLYKNKRVSNISVPHTERRTGEVSIKKWKLLEVAVKSTIQIVLIKMKNYSKS